MDVYLDNQASLYHLIPNQERAINARVMACTVQHKYDLSYYAIDADLRRGIDRDAAAVEFMCEYLNSKAIVPVPTKYQLKVRKDCLSRQLLPSNADGEARPLLVSAGAGGEAQRAGGRPARHSPGGLRHDQLLPQHCAGRERCHQVGRISHSAGHLQCDGDRPRVHHEPGGVRRRLRRVPVDQDCGSRRGGQRGAAACPLRVGGALRSSIRHGPAGYASAYTTDCPARRASW